MNDLDYFYKAITSPVADVIGFVVFIFSICCFRLYTKRIKKIEQLILIDDKNSKFDKR